MNSLNGLILSAGMSHPELHKRCIDIAASQAQTDRQRLLIGNIIFLLHINHKPFPTPLIDNNYTLSDSSYLHTFS